MQKHLSNFQKILVDLLSIDKKVEEMTEVLVLLSSLPFFEFLVITLLIEESTIKMEDFTFTLL